MSDWGTARDNIERIEKMMPLSEREKELALMQFDYTGTNGMEDEDEFKDNPAIKHLFEGDL